MSVDASPGARAQRFECDDLLLARVLRPYKPHCRYLQSGEYSPTSALISGASWRFMAPNPGIDCWTVWSGRRDTFLLIPVDRDEVYGWASTAGAEGLTSLREAFAAFPAPVPETLEAALRNSVAPFRSPLEEVRLPRWSRERVLLVGDAAHATAPVWAQGAGLAVEDALTVADLLATKTNWADVGPEYERRRRGRVQHVQAMTDRVSRLAAMPTWLRNVVTPRLGPRSYHATYGPLRATAVASRDQPSSRQRQKG